MKTKKYRKKMIRKASRHHYKTEEPFVDDAIIMTYIAYPFIFYPICVEQKIPVLLGLFGWAFAPVTVFVSAMCYVFKFAGTWTF